MKTDPTRPQGRTHTLLSQGVDDTQPLITGHKLVAAVFRHKRLLTFPAALGLLVGLVIAIKAPNVYESNGVFLVRNGGENIVVNPLPSEGNSGGWSQGMNITQNAETILLSDVVAKRVIKRVGPSVIMTPYRPKLPQSARNTLFSQLRGLVYDLQNDIHQAGYERKCTMRNAIKAFHDGLTVEIPPRSNLIHVSYQGHNRLVAKQILETYMEEARRYHLEVYDDASSVKLLESTHREAQEQLEAAKAARSAFVKSHGISDFDAEFAAAKAAHEEQLADIRRLKSGIANRKLMLGVLAKRLKKINRFVEVEERVTEPNPRVAVLRTHILEIEAKLRDLHGRVKPTDPQIVLLQRQLADSNAELERELKVPPVVRNFKRQKDNVEYSGTKKTIEDTKLALVLDENALNVSKAGVQAAEAEFERYKSLEPEYTVLTKQVARLTSKVESSAAGLEVAKEKQLLGDRSISTLKVLDEASTPMMQIGPDRYRILIGGTLAGLFIGLVLVFLRAVTDQTLRTPDDIERLLGVKMLATVPQLNSKHIRRHRRLRITGWY